MNIKQTSNKNQTVVYTITVPQKDIDVRYAAALKKMAQDVAVEGFRKGKAPIDIAEKQLGKERIFDQLIQTLLPEAYKQILDKDKLQPVIAPKVELKKAKEGEDWIIEMSVALQPIVTVPDYKKIAKEVRGNAKKNDIWVPGKDADPKTAEAMGKEDVEKKEKYLNELLKALLEKTKIEISDIIIDQEMNQRLSRLLDDVRKIGLTIEAYLDSRNTTQDKLKEEFKTDILNTYKMEYALNEIGDTEGITIEKDDVEKLIASMPDEKSKEEAQQNAYVYTMMMRKQKILDFLSSL
jgi:FKBP-type peptidyl-prolyl cis-trans isomerase (trigger factor)